MNGEIDGLAKSQSSQFIAGKTTTAHSPTLGGGDDVLQLVLVCHVVKMKCSAVVGGDVFRINWLVRCSRIAEQIDVCTFCWGAVGQDDVAGPDWGSRFCC